MRKANILTGVLLGIVAFGCAWASVANRLDLRQLTRGSDRIVVARLLEGTSSWDMARQRIYSVFRFRVDEEIAGCGPSEFTIVQPGGQVDNLAQITHGYPRFDTGGSLLLFLRQRADGYQVVGLSQGVFGLEREGESETWIQRLEGLTFPKNNGIPIRIEVRQAALNIRRLWAEREAG